jgi:hypothetical protein
MQRFRSPSPPCWLPGRGPAFSPPRPRARFGAPRARGSLEARGGGRAHPLPAPPDAPPPCPAAPRPHTPQARYRQALNFHPAYFDGLCALGQLEFERAKLRARLIVKPTPPPPPPAEGAPTPTPEEERAAADAAAAAQAQALRAGLARVAAADVEAAAAYLEKADEWYKAAAAAAEAADAKRKQEQAVRKQGGKGGKGAGGASTSGGGEEEENAAATFAGQTRIMAGNTWYEWSQLLAAAGKEWRPVLDRAVGLFRAAACSDADVRAALKNHARAEELDLGPEPEAGADAGAGAGAAPAAAKKT